MSGEGRLIFLKGLTLHLNYNLKMKFTHWWSHKFLLPI